MREEFNLDALVYPASTPQVCKALRIYDYKLAYLLRNELIPAPRVISGRRIWTRADVETAAIALGKIKTVPGARQRPAECT